MFLTEQIQVGRNPAMSALCHCTKNLWNSANWYIRQEFFYIENFLFYDDLDFILKSKEVYKALPAQTAQQTLKLVEKSWKSFFAAMRVWKKDRFKLLGRPRPPK